MQVVINPIVTIYQLLALAIGFTAITFIALMLWLDRAPKPLPVQFPAKPKFANLQKLRIVSTVGSTRR